MITMSAAYVITEARFRAANPDDFSGCHACWQRLVEASVVFGVGHGPVDAVIVSEGSMPGEGLAAVVSSAERIHIGP